MKPLYSMTGFATARANHPSGEMTCEIRSVNSRYLEMFVKTPPNLREFEDAVKDAIRGKLNRGKINCAITFTAAPEGVVVPNINPGIVAQYKALLDQVRQAAGLEDPVRLSDLLQFPELFASGESSLPEDFKDALVALIGESCDNLMNTRNAEGENLKKDLLERLSVIQKLTEEITELGKGNARSEFEKLHGRLLGMIDEQKIDRNRLEMELALISDRVDISEESVRMLSHLKLFAENLEKGSPIGKTLNFILQEMHREANTMSSKASLLEMSHRIVTVKEEIERMREQIQNIE